MLPHMEGSLQGRLLIATPTLGDPNFAGSVVLIAEHDEQGAMGLVLNRPLAVTVADAVPMLSGFVSAAEPVHQGGPVQPEAVMALGDFVDGNRSAAIAFGTVVIPAHIDDCFTERPEELWKQALRRHGGHLALFSLQPDDPSLN